MTAPSDPASVLALLRDLEWTGWQNVGDGRTLPCCPCCRRFQYPVDIHGRCLERKGHQHNADCRLHTTILALKAQEAAPQPATADAIRLEALESYDGGNE